MIATVYGQEIYSATIHKKKKNASKIYWLVYHAYYDDDFRSIQKTRSKIMNLKSTVLGFIVVKRKRIRQKTLPSTFLRPTTSGDYNGKN